MNVKNKLNIYYIKPQRELVDIFKDDLTTYKTIEFLEGKLYYNPKTIHEPEWVKGFFKESLVVPTQRDDGSVIERYIFNVASSQAIFIKEIEIFKKKHLFALPFGSGIHLLKSDSYVPNFGLKCVLNLISEDNCLRKLSKYDISSSPKQTSQQLSKKGSQIDFNIDHQTDILTGITGTFNDKSKRDNRLINLIGKTITGKHGFSVSASADISNVSKVLRLSLAAYNSDRYKNRGFNWIDNVSYIKNDSVLLSKLNDELDNQLKNIIDENDKIWLAVPEIIRWEDISGFYFGRNKRRIDDDLNLIQFKDYIEKQNKVLSIETLKQHHIYAKDAKKDGCLYCWDAFQCLNAEIELNVFGKQRTFMLIDKNWYEINKDFQEETEIKFKEYFDNMSGLNFIDCDCKDEEIYNQKLAKQYNLICLDRKTVSHGGGKSKIEVCDILDINNKNLIHIKKYSGSSVLSHLFSQGLISMKLLINDKKFLREVERKVKTVSGAPFSFDNAVRDYSLTYAIIAKSGCSKVNIPFFSKVNLNSVCDRLCKEMNVTVHFDVIKNTYTSKKS